MNGVYKADKEYESLGLEKTIFHEILESDLPRTRSLLSACGRKHKLLLAPEQIQQAMRSLLHISIS